MKVLVAAGVLAYAVYDPMAAIGVFAGVVAILAIALLLEWGIGRNP